jgi:hypothetical protein
MNTFLHRRSSVRSLGRALDAVVHASGVAPALDANATSSDMEAALPPAPTKGKYKELEWQFSIHPGPFSRARSGLEMCALNPFRGDAF